MKTTLLVISNKWDAHADAVIRETQRLGSEVIRINTEDFRKNKMHFSTANDESIEWNVISPEGRILSERTISGVYIRRLKMPIDVSDIDSRFQDFARNETRAFLLGLEGLLSNARWLNHPYERERASNKILQLITAKKVGLVIPDTLITNEGKIGQQFCLSESSIYKTLDCPVVNLGDEGHCMINTSLVDEKTDFSGVVFAPALFQHYIPKQYELRIHIIGTKIIPIKIDSQNNPRSTIDWRINQNELLYEETTLPENISQKLLRFMAELRIQFGIVDMIVTKGGEYVFLEINPDGNWLWIEQKIQAPISEYIARYFLNNHGETYHDTL